MQFGGKPPTYKRLLDALGARDDCAVTLQAEKGISGLKGDTSGPLYYVERYPEKKATEQRKPSEMVYSFIEVFHEQTIVEPNRLRVICRELGLDEDELRAAIDTLP